MLRTCLHNSVSIAQGLGVRSAVDVLVGVILLLFTLRLRLGLGPSQVSCKFMEVLVCSLFTFRL